MSRKFMAVVAALLTVVLLVGCGGGASKQFSVGMVTDVGGLGDQSFNDAAHRGLKQAEADLKAKIAVVESNKLDDYESNLKTLYDQKMSVIWSIGFLLTDATKAAATTYPDGQFAIIDSVVADDAGTPLKNVASVVFKEHEGSFLVGMLAAKATKTGKIGFVGGMDIPLIRKFEAGFRAGVKAVDPNLTVTDVYTGVFDDVNKGKEAAIALYSQNVDVIYAAAGACGIGVIEAAKEQGKLAIGVDSDQNHLAPDNVLSSMMKRVDVAVFSISKQASEGKFPGGTITALGLKEDGVGYSDTTLWNKLPDGTKDLVDKWRQGIVDGTVVVPETIDDAKAWAPPAI